MESAAESTAYRVDKWLFYRVMSRFQLLSKLTRR